MEGGPEGDHPMITVHATTVAIEGRGVLLRGASGSGKSDLALRLIDAGAELVADDHTQVISQHSTVFAEAPPGLEGLLEVRGVGILTLPHRQRVPLALIADLEGAVERLPQPMEDTLMGIALPRVILAPFEASAPAKLRMALFHGVGTTP